MMAGEGLAAAVLAAAVAAVVGAAAVGPRFAAVVAVAVFLSARAVRP